MSISQFDTLTSYHLRDLASFLTKLKLTALSHAPRLPNLRCTTSIKDIRLVALMRISDVVCDVCQR